MVGVQATVGRLPNNFFRRFKQIGKILKQVAERPRDSRRRSRDRWLTVKQLFSTFQTNWQHFEKSCWTITRQWSKVTRPSADSRTTFFRRFNRNGIVLKKVAERFESVVGRSRDGRLTVKQFYLDVSTKMANFWKSLWTVTRQSSKITRPSTDCQTTSYRRFNRNGKILKKSLNGQATVVGGHATVGRLSNNFLSTVQPK